MPSSALLRAALALSATGVVSAASIRHAIEESGTDIPFAIGFAFYFALILLSTLRRPPRWAASFALALVAITYVLAVVTIDGNVIGMALYLVAATLAYAATPRDLRPLAVAAFALWTPSLRFFGPEPLGGAFPPILALAAVLALLNLAGALLDRSAGRADERLRRVGFGLLAVAVVATVSERHLVVASAGVAPDDLMALIVVGVLPLLSVLPLRAVTRDALATGLALAAFALVTLALLSGKGYHVDSVTVPHRAAELLLMGTNPYRTFDLPQALAQFGLDPQLVTHFEDGTELRSLNYPAFSFLVVVPFIAAGLGDIRWIYFGEIVLATLVLLRRASLPWRPMIAAAVIGNTILVRQNVLAGADPTWALLLTLGWVFLESRWLSPLAVGLAAAARQPAWFVAPFYVAAIWKRDGPQEALRRGAVVAAAAIVPNLPFFLDAPREFVDGVAAPMVAPLAPYGVGLVRLGIDGAMPLFERGVYGALSAASFVVLMAVLWRWWRALPAGALVFPFVPLYFAWRSLQNYFAWLPIFAMAADDEALVAAKPPAVVVRSAPDAQRLATVENALGADRPRAARDSGLS